MKVHMCRPRYLETRSGRVHIYYALPKGWRVIEGAMTAPVGYKWISNGKSIFDRNNYKSALLKEV